MTLRAEWITFLQGRQRSPLSFGVSVFFIDNLPQSAGKHTGQRHSLLRCDDLQFPQKIVGHG